MLLNIVAYVYCQENIFYPNINIKPVELRFVAWEKYSKRVIISCNTQNTKTHQKKNWLLLTEDVSLRNTSESMI